MATLPSETVAMVTRRGWSAGARPTVEVDELRVGGQVRSVFQTARQHSTIGSMSDERVPEPAPARPWGPSRTARKRDERVRRVVRTIRKHATWLDAPHFASQLYAYGVLFVRFVDIRSVKAEPWTIWAGRTRSPIQLTRIAGRLGQLAAQPGLSTSA
jgi:hypothetical protein